MGSLFDDPKQRLAAVKTIEFFWKLTLPRLVCMMPVLQSCMLLMTTAHEHVQNADYAFRQDPKYINKYVAALSDIREQYSCLSVECILLASLLLALGELAYGPSAAGYTHLDSAWRIRQQWQDKASVILDHHQKEEVEGMGAAIDLLYSAWFQKMSRVNFLPQSAKPLLDAHTEGTRIVLGLPFSTLQQLVASLQDNKDRARRFMLVNPGARNSKKVSELQKQARNWDEAFDKFMAVPREVKAWGFDLACLVIRIHGDVGMILASLPTTVLEFDRLRSYYSRIADTAEELFELVGGDIADTAREELIQGIGLINPLFYAATTCRDYALRRRLLAVLKVLQMAEGPWTSCIAWQIAVHLCRIEEKAMEGSSTSTLIPWSDRPRLLTAQIVNSTTMTLMYTLKPYTNNEEECTENFGLRPCTQQIRLMSELWSIGELGGSKGQVRESDCDCIMPGAVLSKIDEVSVWQQLP